MTRWNKNIDDVGTSDETEVHEIKLSTLIVEVFRMVGETKWTMSIATLNDDIVEMREGSEDLIRSKMAAITMANTHLQSSLDTLALAMQEAHNEATERRDKLLK